MTRPQFPYFLVLLILLIPMQRTGFLVIVSLPLLECDVWGARSWWLLPHSQLGHQTQVGWLWDSPTWQQTEMWHNLSISLSHWQNRCNHCKFWMINEDDCKLRIPDFISVLRAFSRFLLLFVQEEIHLGSLSHLKSPVSSAQGHS